MAGLRLGVCWRIFRISPQFPPPGRAAGVVPSLERAARAVPHGVTTADSTHGSIVLIAETDVSLHRLVKRPNIHIPIDSRGAVA